MRAAGHRLHTFNHHANQHSWPAEGFAEPCCSYSFPAVFPARYHGTHLRRGAVLDSTRMTHLSVVQRFRAAHVRGLNRTRPKSSVEQWHSQQQRRRGGAGPRSGRRRVTFDGAAVGQLTGCQHCARVCGHPPGLSHCRRQELLALDPRKPRWWACLKLKWARYTVPKPHVLCCEESEPCPLLPNHQDRLIAPNLSSVDPQRQNCSVWKRHFSVTNGPTKRPTRNEWCRD